MPRGGSKPGERRGGRKSGTTNKDKAELRAMLASKFPDWDPVVAMAKIATTTADVNLELQACKEVAQYTHPKLKAVELSGKDGDALEFIVDLKKAL